MGTLSRVRTRNTGTMPNMTCQTAKAVGHHALGGPCGTEKWSEVFCTQAPNRARRKHLGDWQWKGILYYCTKLLKELKQVHWTAGTAVLPLFSFFYPTWMHTESFKNKQLNAQTSQNWC